MEATDLGYDLEVEMIRTAGEMDVFTSPYVFSEDKTGAMTGAGADLLIPHVGLTTAGTIGAASALTSDGAINKVMSMADATWMNT